MRSLVRARRHASRTFTNGHPNVKYLYAEPQKAAADWYKRTKIFPIMHLLGVRRSLAEQHPWLPGAVAKQSQRPKAFERSKHVALTKLSDTSATKVTLLFVEEQLRAARQLMGDDFWSYSFDANRHVLQRFMARHHAEGLSSRRLEPEELFHPATSESFKI